jgi:hypothetical protein
MREAAQDNSFLRGRERRHFRGLLSRKSVAWLEHHFEGWATQRIWSDLETAETAKQVVKLVTEWVGFGNWIAFKVADMLERLELNSKLKFEASELTLYDSPRHGAKDIWDMESAHWGDSGEVYIGGEPCDVTGWGVEFLLMNLVGQVAPPSGNRPVNIQEAETVMCKYHAYLNGNYHIGEDIRALKQALDWDTNPISERLLTAGAYANLW